MPNAPIAGRTIATYLSVIEGIWRVRMSRLAGGGYTAQFEQQRGDEWRAIGPIAASRRSEIMALSRLASGYRSFAAALEQRWSFTGRGRLLDGCPHCGYTHLQLSEVLGCARWHCIACGRFGSKSL